MNSKKSSFDIRGGLKIRDRGLGFFIKSETKTLLLKIRVTGCEENNFDSLPFGQAEAETGPKFSETHVFRRISPGPGC